MKRPKEQQSYQAIIQKAWEDTSFKAALIANPVAAIEAFTGEKVSIPAGKTLLVQDQTAEDRLYLNIPAKQDNVALQEEELEAVSGGTGNPLLGPLVLSELATILGSRTKK